MYTLARRISLVFVLFLVLVAFPASVRGQAGEAPGILEAAGFTGGIILHLGSGDGHLTAALSEPSNSLVLGLDDDRTSVAGARKRLRGMGIYGRVTTEWLSGHVLPFVDNMVNLVVVSDAELVPPAEIMRVLAPGGGVVRKNAAGSWAKTVKARPDSIDAWTHFLYDATNSAVSKDREIEPPTRLQWMGSPRWGRHHDHMASMTTMVSDGDRIYYVFDEGSTASILLPAHWQLIARDAWNGTVLWKRPIKHWFTHLWPLKSGPGLLPRRMVVAGGELYVTMGLDGPVEALNPITGKTTRTYAGTEKADEILYSDGVLFVVVNREHEKRWETSGTRIGELRKATKGGHWGTAKGTVMAIDAPTGRALWTVETSITPGTVAVDSTKVCCHGANGIVALDRKTGRQLWTSDPVPVLSQKKFISHYTPTLVLYKDVVLWSGGENYRHGAGDNGTMTGLDGATGRKLWSAPHPPSGYASAEDMFVVDGLVWAAATIAPGSDGVYRGYDPRSGELKREFKPGMKPYWFHHRCYRGKATEKYMIISRTGTEFIDPRKETWKIHHWVRGGCMYGIMPANGMLYNPTIDCVCYAETKLFGFNAVAPTPATMTARRAKEPAERLEKGPAYGNPEVRSQKSEVGNPAIRDPRSAPRASDWPTHRHDNERTGVAGMAVPAKLGSAWKKQLGGRLSSVVVANGLLYVAQIDQHTIHVLDAKTGEAVWSYTVGGRVDSPPTIWKGLCLFGSTDGYVYCLTAADGVLVWRFLAAPIDERQFFLEQIESVWPVHGSVLVQDGIAWFTAGRNLFIDGGIRLYRLEARTGKVLSVTTMDDRDPETGKDIQDRHRKLQMPVGLPDVLASDGSKVYMRSQVFNLEGKREGLGPITGHHVLQGTVQRGQNEHLFAANGFLDGSWWHRSYWVYGKSFSAGWNGYYQAGRFAPSGRLLVVDRGKVYGYGRKSAYYRWTTPLEYHVFATNRRPPALPSMFDIDVKGPLKTPWVQVQNSESLDPSNKALAVEAWVKANDGKGVVVSRGGSQDGYVLFLLQGRPHFGVRRNSILHDVAGRANVVGRWVHLAGVITADAEALLFVNGRLAGKKQLPGFLEKPPGQITTVGADDGSPAGNYRNTFALNSVIDEVRIYHGSVTPQEIKAHFDDVKSRVAAAAQLVLHLDFDEGKALDRSGKGNNGSFERAEFVAGKAGKGVRVQSGLERSGHYVPYDWSHENPAVLARAMVKAGPHLFVAGPPDGVDENTVARRTDLPANQAKLKAQEAALAGKRGAKILVFATADGTAANEIDLESIPVWDGMIAAGGKLFVALENGSVICMQGAE